MLLRYQNNTPVRNLQQGIAAGEACAHLCFHIETGKGLWIVASFESKENKFRLRSVVWQT